MKWFSFGSRNSLPTKSDYRSHKSSGSRSLGRTGGGSSTRKRRRHSHSMSLPRDICNRSYYAPIQKNFYPPNVVHPVPKQSINAQPGYFQDFNHPTTYRGERDYEERLFSEKEYANELHRNQYLFFRRPKNQMLFRNAPYILDSEPPKQLYWDNRHSAPILASPYNHLPAKYRPSIDTTGPYQNHVMVSPKWVRSIPMPSFVIIKGRFGLE